MRSSHIVSEQEFSEFLPGDRKIITPASTFGILRQKLEKNVGIDRIKDVLYQFGFEMGLRDAKEALKSGKSLEELVKYGPQLHIENGQIEGIQHDCKFELDVEQNVISLVGQGIWYNSYEAQEHLKWIGKSQQPVCYTLLGYSSGFMSTIFNEPIMAKELSCVGKGDEHCSWILKPQKQWELENPDESHLFQEMPIVEELQYTYDQLVERQKTITKLLDFQTLLTSEVANGYDLHHILNVAYESIKIPIVVESITANSINYAGVSVKKYDQLDLDLKTYIKENDFNDIYQNQEGRPISISKKVIETENQIRLLAPILVHKELMGWCSFIYERGEPSEDAHLFIDRLASTVSLLLLNEKTKFETFERMKGDFFEQILTKDLSKEELIKRGLFAGVDLTQPYYIAVIDIISKNQSIEKGFILQEKIFESTFKYFKEQQKNILVSRRDSKLTLYIAQEDVETTVESMLEGFDAFLNREFPQNQFKSGISNQYKDITNAGKGFEEARVALKLALKNAVSSYRTLGVLGVLINNENIDAITAIAKQELRELCDMENPRSVELLKTLYSFLVNGGNLEKTKSDLALSMSGLRHRIQRIEAIIEKDLRNTEETYQLLLIIKSLIVTGELTM